MVSVEGPVPHTSSFHIYAPRRRIYTLVSPQRVNGLGHVSVEQLKKEKHAKLFRDHQDAMQTHNGIRETREDLMGQRINNPKM